MCATLAGYGLLEPFNVQATLTKEMGGRSVQLTGHARCGRAEPRESEPPASKRLLDRKAPHRLDSTVTACHRAMALGTSPARQALRRVCT